MADQTNSGGGDPAGAQPGSSALSQEFKAPDGKVLVDAKEWESVGRLREQNVGYQKFHSEAAKLGIKRSEDFGKWGKLDSTLKQRGMSFDKLLAAFEEEGGTAQDIPQGLNPAELKKYMAEFVKEQGFVSRADLEATQNKSLAMLDHREAVGKEKAAIEKLVSALPEGKRGLAGRLINSMLDEKRGVYPDGHALAAEHLAPLDEKTISAVYAEAKKLMALDEGQELAAEADAALKGKGVTSPGGNPASKPDKAKAIADTRPGGRPSVAAVEALASKMQAARGGKAVSSLGG